MALGGLLGNVMKAGAEGVGNVAMMEYGQQKKLDYAKAISDMEEQKLLRIDEVKRDRDITDIGRRTGAEADARLAAAPKVGQAAVAEEVSKVDAATTAGLPEKKAALRGAELRANAPNVAEEGRQKGAAAGAEQVAKTGTAGYMKSIELEDIAKSAGERSVAGITANAPKIQQAADGRFIVVQGGKTTGVLKDPATGEPLMGPKDLDQRTLKMVDALLTGAKGELDPEARKDAVNQALDLLKGSNKTAAPKEGDTATSKSGKPIVYKNGQWVYK